MYPNNERTRKSEIEADGNVNRVSHNNPMTPVTTFRCGGAVHSSVCCLSLSQLFTSRITRLSLLVSFAYVVSSVHLRLSESGKPCGSNSQEIARLL